MKTIEQSYAAFCALLETPSNLSLSFESLCARIHVSPTDLGRHIEDELGFSGQGLLEALKPQNPGACRPA